MKTIGVVLAQYHPLKSPKAILIGLLCAMALCYCEPKTTLAQSPVQHDPNALTVINQSIAAGGGQELLGSIRDFTETGTITYSGATPLTGTATVKGHGLRQFRIDVDLPQGTRTTIVNGEGGSLKQADGRSLPIVRQSANDLGGFTLPYLSLIGAMQDPASSIVYVGLEAHDGTTAYDIRVMKVYTKEQDPTGNRGVQEARDFYIDPQTFFIVAISDRLHFRNSEDAGVVHEAIYSNYQPENGVMAPLTVVETVHGVTGVTMQLSQLTFNSGLADADFSW